MPDIKYLQPNGVEKVVDVPVGETVMQGAVQNGVEGILAECGGACSCATCHAYVEPEWFELVGGPTEDEQDMLEMAEELEPTSRLTCQMVVREEWQGLAVKIPESQA